MACFSYTITSHRFGWLIIELKKSLISSVVISGLSVMHSILKKGMFMIALERDLRPARPIFFQRYNVRRKMCVRGNTSASSITPSSVIPQLHRPNTRKQVSVRLATICLRPSSPILLSLTIKICIMVVGSALLIFLKLYSVISRKLTSKTVVINPRRACAGGLR